MRHSRLPVLLLVFLANVSACQTASSRPASLNASSSSGFETATPNPMPVIHVFVALCDNEHQGIVPVSATLGNGDNPATNLYWGAAFGVKTFFAKSKDWELVADIPNPSPVILVRSVFKHKTQNVFLIAEAYRGREIAQATWDFLEAAAGKPGNAVEVKDKNKTVTI